MTEWIIGAVLLIAAAFGLYRKGRSDESAKQDKQTAESVSKAKKVSDDVANAPVDDVDRRLGKWMRDGR